MQLYIWRHPKPKQVQGLCFGQHEVMVDRRKLKRLAHQILRFVRVNQLPKRIWVSPLQRSKQVGEYLAAQGFECHVDAQLLETHFGAWEGRLWLDISKDEIDQWCEHFADFAPPGGESLRQLFERVAAWIEQQKQTQAELNIDAATTHARLSPKHQVVMHQTVLHQAVLVVGHAGWISSAKFIQQGQQPPTQAAHWPRSVGHGQLSCFKF